MELCLYDHEHGYYSSHVRTIGTGGDFATTPTLATKVRPCTSQTGQGIFHSSQVHLQNGLPCASPVGEDVDDDFMAVDHRHFALRFPIPLLSGRKRVIKDDNVATRHLSTCYDLLYFP